ncbi:MAG TPA: methyltransferase [Chloroflexi bacterium]|nr:methyltransferase [Chloroflexota bacterium]
MTTSRERVMAAVNHREPDRTPIDLGGHRSSGIMAIAYAKLKQHLGITTGDIYVYDFVQQLAIIEPAVLDRFGVDTVELGRGFALRPEDWQAWVLPDGTPCKIPAFLDVTREGDDWRVYHPDGTLLAIQKQGCLYLEQTHWPYSDRTTDETGDVDYTDLADAFDHMMWSKVGAPPAPIGLDPQGLAELAAGAKAFRATTDRAIIGLFGAPMLEGGQQLFGMDNFLAMLAGEKTLAHRFLDRLVAYYLDRLHKFLSAVGPYIDIILFSDDFGMQTGPQISPRMYREFFQPRQKILWEASKKLAPAKIMLHSCGGIHPLLPGMIEAGLEIVQPVQTTCRDMEPERLKREYGKDVCLWGGGSNTRNILGWATPEKVAADVRERVAIFAPGGGYVFQQIHNVMANVPPEHIVAMLDAVN